MQHPTNNKKTLTKVPQSWADFWNVKDFPGFRALRNDQVVEALELAGDKSKAAKVQLIFV